MKLRKITLCLPLQQPKMAMGTEAARYADAPGTACAPPPTLHPVLHLCAAAEVLRTGPWASFFLCPFPCREKYWLICVGVCIVLSLQGPGRAQGQVGLVPSSGVGPEHCQKGTQTSGGRLEALAPQAACGPRATPLPQPATDMGRLVETGGPGVQGDSGTIAQANWHSCPCHHRASPLLSGLVRTRGDRCCH